MITDLLGTPSLEAMRTACEGARAHILRGPHKQVSLTSNNVPKKAHGVRSSIMKDNDSLVDYILCKRSLALIFLVPGSLIINRPCGAAMVTWCSCWVTELIDRSCTLFMESSRSYCPRSAEISHQPLLQDSQRSTRYGPLSLASVPSRCLSISCPASYPLTDWLISWWEREREGGKESHDSYYWHIWAQQFSV